MTVLSTNEKAAAIIRSLLDDCEEMVGEDTLTEYQSDILYRYNWNTGLQIDTWDRFRLEAERIIAELAPANLFLQRIDY